MDYLEKKKREKVEAEAEKLFGNDILLKTVYVLNEMKAPKEEVDATLAILREDAIAAAKEYEETMQFTLDSCGNMIELVPMIENIVAVEDTINVEVVE
jgi:hypothetical protein